MTSQLPSPAPQAPPEPPGKAARSQDSGSSHERVTFSRTKATLRKLSIFAPLAAAYGAFQCVISSLPPSLSNANLHYLLAVASGLAVGGIVACAMLLVRKPPSAVSEEEEEATAAETGTAPPGRRSSNGAAANTAGLFRMCGQTLLDTVVRFDDPQIGRLTGWPHFFDEAEAGYRPTPYGTAYGLKAALAIGGGDGRLDRGALTETLWKLRRSDGGWASRSQGNVSRPEVTAVALGALATAGCDATRLADAGDTFEAMLAPGVDPVGMTSTFVVSSLVRELVRIRPNSPRLPQLTATLLNGAARDHRREGLLCWSSHLDRRGLAVPSAAHTSLAVVALARALQLSPTDKQSQLAMEQAVRWLVLASNLDNQTEQIRRSVSPDHTELLNVNLFTAAWTARALMAAEGHGLRGFDELLADSIKAIVGQQHDGIWEWTDGSRPLWATYQGISTLLEFRLRR